MKKLSLLIFLAAIYCCTPKAMQPLTDADVERCKGYWADCSMNKLSEARRIYNGKCGTCHALYAPGARTEEQWRKIVPPMAGKAKLTVEEQTQVLAYVLSMREVQK